MNQPPLNPDALDKAALAMCHYVVANREMGHGIRPVYHQYQSAKAAVSAYLTATMPEVTSVEELEALPQGSVIRSVVFGVVRERFDSGWLATGGEGFDQSSDIAGRAHVVIYRPGVNDA